MPIKKLTLLSMPGFRQVVFSLIPILALILGGSIYIYLRPSEHVFFNWIRAIGLENLLGSGIHPLSHLSFPDWFVYSLPNGLWAFAYTFLIRWIWAGNRSWIRIVWMVSIPLLVFGFEGLQYLDIIQGTACVQDLLAGLLGISLGIIVIKLTFNSNKNEKAIS